jgi:predicted Zn-ribbon and HTH transcriptional regulator
MKDSSIIEENKCPKCNSDWTDGLIPEKDRHLFGNKKNFSRLISIYDHDRDRTVAFECPDCKERFDRG